MAMIPVRSAYTPISEGAHIFQIKGVDYDEDFGILKIELATESGKTHQEKFTLKDSNGDLNDKALNAWSYFAQTAMNDYDIAELDPADLIGHYIEADVEHTQSPSKKDPSRMMTFVRLGRKAPAAGFASAADNTVADLDSLLD